MGVVSRNLMRDHAPRSSGRATRVRQLHLQEPNAMSRLIALTRTLCQKEATIAARLQHVFLLVVRLYWGWQFFLTGRGKLMNIERTADFLNSLGIPLPTLNAYAAGS